ncbi:YbjN domain-containing protein [Jonesiaceae bacterium BS-20]|uniref:YbjN domain-containing protein n=1 Tax=Jonesiaceae bacterium BS-20 TaxID=3120821 RepID=A0AAU7DWZ9_9MICO
MSTQNTNSSDPGKLDPTILLPGTVSYLDLVNPDKFGRKAPEPLTKERVIEHLADRGYRFSIDDDGDPVGVWDQNLVWFMFLGTDENFLQVRARWHRKVATLERLSLLQALNDWNRDKLWPKVFARAEEDSPEHLHVYAEISCDFSAGATDHQLHQAIDLSLEGALMFFDSLGQSLPPSLDD